MFSISDSKVFVQKTTLLESFRTKLFSYQIGDVDDVGSPGRCIGCPRVCRPSLIFKNMCAVISNCVGRDFFGVGPLLHARL